MDAAIDFNWGEYPALQTPYPFPSDYFSVSWTGYVAGPVTDLYTFYVSANGGVRLWLNGSLVIDSWAIAAVELATPALLLTAGQTYDITLQYRDGSGPSSIRLQWSCASGAFPKSVVPSTALYNARHLLGSPHPVVFYPGALVASTSNAAVRTRVCVALCEHLCVFGFCIVYVRFKLAKPAYCSM